MELKLCALTLFGLEGLVADELRRLGMKDVAAENGRVTFTGGPLDIARANINLRTAERVLIMLGEFEAKSFDGLFEGTKALPWEDFVPAGAAFPVKGYSIDSALHSVPDCQSIVKKAVADRLAAKYKKSWLDETGAKRQIRFSIMKDRAGLFIDTSGVGLHKRGYRPESAAAPLRETLAAAMVNLSRYRGREEFYDPFCGSGTIAVEAALTALNRAPGLNRGFDAKHWELIGSRDWTRAEEEAKSREYTGDYRIWGGDIDPKCTELSKINARRAGVEHIVRFETADAMSFYREGRGGLIVTNPPYGERLSEKSEAAKLYAGFGQAFSRLEDFKLYLLSSHTEFEREFGIKAKKKRKLYNGMIKCDLFMFF